MPIHDFNSSFFQPLGDPIDSERLKQTLRHLYSNQDPVYFSTVHATEFNAFKRSADFTPFKYQYMQLVASLNKWCDDRGLIKSHPDPAHAAGVKAKLATLLQPVNQWALTQRLPPVSFNNAPSPLIMHLILLFSDDLPQSYNDRAMLYFHDGKQSLERLLMLLSLGDSEDKKKDVMSNLLEAIVACADGALTHVFEAKDALLAVLNAKALFEQAKRDVIRQIAIGYHKQTKAGKPLKGLALLRARLGHVAVDRLLSNLALPRGTEDERYQHLICLPELRPTIMAIEAREAAVIAAHEVHYGSAYMDTVAATYGIEKRNDDFKEPIHPATLQYFSVYVNTEITPALMIESLVSQFELLYQALHQKFVVSFNKKSVVDMAAYVKFQSALQTAVDDWNTKYQDFCPLSLYDFISMNEEATEVTLKPYESIQLKASITKKFEEKYLTDAAASKTHTFKFVKEDDDENEALDAEEDTVEYHQGVAWRVHQESIVRLTPEAFLNLEIPKINTPEFLYYWSIFNTMLLDFPTHHAELLSALYASPYKEAVHALTKRPHLIDRLIRQKQFALLEFLQTNGLLVKEYVIYPRQTVEEDAISLERIFSRYSVNPKDPSKAFRIVSDRGTLEELKLLLRVAPYVLDQQGDTSLKTALHRALEKNQFDRVHFLVGAGARIDIADSAGKTAKALFHEMLANPETNNVKLKLYFDVAPKDNAEKKLWTLLVKYRAEKTDQLGSVVRRAAFEGNADDLVTALAIEPTLIDQQEEGADSKKRTALHIALEENRPEVVEILVMAGAKRQIRNADQQTVDTMASNDPRRDTILKTAVKKAEHKAQVLSQLDQYIKRIEELKGDFEQGFSLLAQSRGLSRQVHYEFARELRDELIGTTCGAEMAQVLSPASLARLRLKVIHQVIAIHNNPHFVDRGFTSAALNAVLDLGQKNFPLQPNPSFELKKAQLKAKLEAYILRVEDDPSAGFFFFSALRTGSRKVNLALARDLLQKLESTKNENDVAKLFVEQRLQSTRTKGKPKEVTRFSDKINSCELTQAITFARESFKLKPKMPKATLSR